jgi:cyclopropane-fatty-acyl-phospholipid synthase
MAGLGRLERLVASPRQMPVADRLGTLLSSLEHASELELPHGEIRRFGSGEPTFRLTLRSERSLTGPLTELALARAYVNGDVDIDVADDVTAVFAARDRLRPGMSLRHAVRLLAELALRPPTAVNARAASWHYSLGNDFYLTFLDDRYHFYSQCLFESDDESLETAAEHKLERMWEQLELRPGMRLLDIGGGWGGVVQYCGERGVHVTSLTLSKDSARFIRARADAGGLPCEVRLEDLLDHRPDVPYDNAVIFGVIEHIPTYGRFCESVWGALKPGGRLYLDASATLVKYAGSPFTRLFTWSGPHSCLALPDMLEELLFHGFDVVGVRREAHDYELTMRHWATRLDTAHASIAERWGEDVYRAFRIFLWGGAHALHTNRLQAYSLVAQRRADRGPRPGVAWRLGHFVLSLR